ncbi:hypothetical protein E2C01_064700 [Portunus trituberculatus]|uniref:Uncharacterized protein n=1 Tax=Portunus trituberculatus TaxID=210409 RepID=A0A5B7HCI6_PORTR|nr:hypothetical protein [Portunus trituberculatus]
MYWCRKLRVTTESWCVGYSVAALVSGVEPREARRKFKVSEMWLRGSVDFYDCLARPHRAVPRPVPARPAPPRPIRS